MDSVAKTGCIDHTLDPTYAAKLREEDLKERDALWKIFEDRLSENKREITLAMKELYTIYGEGLVKWMANLYDPDICICNEVYGKAECEHHPLCGTAAFHYTHSARDNVGFAPVIEGTNSVYNFIEGSGLSRGKSAKEYLDEVVGDKILRFAINLQDPDGYFYHPQWGKSIGIGRRARDYDRAKWLMARYGVTPRYASISDVGEKTNDTVLIPDHLKTPDAFREYLDSLSIDTRSYPGGSVIAAQFSQIKARGQKYLDILGDFLDAHQRTDNGIWHAEINYEGVNGLMKISGPYCHMKRPMPQPEKAVRAAITAIMSDENPGSIVAVWNPWIALERVLTNITAYHDPKIAEKIRSDFMKRAPEAIRKTRIKTEKFRHEDGSFSYFQGRSTHTMQGSPCGIKNTPEGDMDAAVLGTNAMVEVITDVLNVTPYKVPIYGRYESEMFLDILKNRSPVRH